MPLLQVSYLALLLCSVASFAPALLAKEAPRPKIAFIHKGSYLDFWQSMKAGADRAAGERGVELIFKGSPYADNTPAQIKLVDAEVSSGIDALVIAPTDRVALEEPVKRATERGVKVIVVDSALNGSHHLSYIGTDNFDAGKRAAAKLAELIGGRGEVLVLRLVKDSASTDSRADGFLAEMAKHKNVKVVADAYGGALVGSAHTAMKELMTKHPNVVGIFCVNESTTLGALTTLRELQLAKKIRFVGFDSSRQLLDALNAGDIDTLVVQDPVEMGYAGIMAALDALQKKPLTKTMHTGVQLVTKDNVNSPAIQALVAPSRKGTE